MVGRHAAHSSRWGLALGAVVLAGAAVGAGATLGHDATTTTAPSTTSLPVTTLPPVTTTTTPATVTISAVGDTELGNTPQVPSNPAAYLANIAARWPRRSSSATSRARCTTGPEGPSAARGRPMLRVQGPDELAPRTSATGFTVMNSANNHSHDFGNPGLLSTSAALRAARLVQAGLAGQIPVVRVGSVKVAFVDFAPYSNLNDMLDATTPRR